MKDDEITLRIYWSRPSSVLPDGHSRGILHHICNRNEVKEIIEKRRKAMDEEGYDRRIVRCEVYKLEDVSNFEYADWIDKQIEEWKKDLKNK